jgi:hypothetical protein
LTSHLLNTVTEFVCSKKPTDRNGLEETHPQKGQARTRIEIHQLEKIHATVGTHWNASDEHEEAHSHSKFATMFQQSLGIIVNEASYQSFHVAEFGVNAENQKHYEENESP